VVRSERLVRPVYWLGVATALGMLLVLVMGFLVTASGSAQGCGRQWPLCNGRFIPDFAVSTAIEFSHRAVTGVESVLVVAFAGAVLLLYRRQRPILVLASLMLGFLFLQAAMGALAVVYPEQAVVLALHFGISLIALASAALTAAYVRRPGAMREVAAVPRRVVAATWGMAAYLYALVYGGAYIRHAGDAAACTSWPLCGTGAALGRGAVAVDLLHRFGAGAAVLGAIGLLVLYRLAAPARADLTRGAWLLLGMLVAQGAAGGLLVLSGFAVTSELLHAALTGLTFTAAAYLCLRVAVAAPGPAVAGAAALAGADSSSRLRTEGSP
jgi:cytochrome c oxidase assembly protein subunit 15